MSFAGRLVVDEHNKRGIPLVAHGLAMRLDFRFTLEEQWNLFDNINAWREATLGTAEERKAKLVNPKLRQAMREEYDRTKRPKALGDIAEVLAVEPNIRLELEGNAGMAISIIFSADTRPEKEIGNDRVDSRTAASRGPARRNASSRHRSRHAYHLRSYPGKDIRSCESAFESRGKQPVPTRYVPFRHGSLRMRGVG